MRGARPASTVISADSAIETSGSGTGDASSASVPPKATYARLATNSMMRMPGPAHAFSVGYIPSHRFAVEAICFMFMHHSPQLDSCGKLACLELNPFSHLSYAIARSCDIVVMLWLQLRDDNNAFASGISQDNVKSVLVFRPRRGSWRSSAAFAGDPS